MGEGGMRERKRETERIVSWLFADRREIIVEVRSDEMR